MPSGWLLGWLIVIQHISDLFCLSAVRLLLNKLTDRRTHAGTHTQTCVCES